VDPVPDTSDNVFRFVRDPDCAPTDRIKSAIRVVLCSMFVVACLIGYGAGVRAYQSGLAVERIDAEGYPVTGRVLSHTPQAATDSGVAALTSARIAWRDRQQARHQQTMWIDISAASSGSIPLWISGDGTAGRFRHSHDETVSNAVLTAVLVVLVSGCGLTAGYLLMRLLLRRRDRRVVPGQDLDEQWAEVEPRWRRQLL